MNSFESRLLQNCNQKIEELYDAEARNIATGKLPDYSAYRQKCGFLDGLAVAIRIMAEEEKNLANNQSGEKK